MSKIYQLLVAFLSSFWGFFWKKSKPVFLLQVSRGYGVWETLEKSTDKNRLEMARMESRAQSVEDLTRAVMAPDGAYSNEQLMRVDLFGLKYRIIPENEA